MAGVCNIFREGLITRRVWAAMEFSSVAADRYQLGGEIRVGCCLPYTSSALVWNGPEVSAPVRRDADSPGKSGPLTVAVGSVLTVVGFRKGVKRFRGTV